MSNHQLIVKGVSFDELADRLVELGCSNHPSEVHGLLCGQLAAGHRLEETQWCKQVSELLGDKTLDDACTQTVNRLYASTLQHLTASDFAIRLLLPDDDEAIEQRADALGVWCESFLSGFGEGIQKQSLSEEVNSVLHDLAEIAQIQSSIDEGEEAERYLLEVGEYVRMALITVFDELKTPASAIAKPSKKLH